MKTWDDWSDFEINKAVADVCGVFWHCAPCRSTGHKWLYSDNYDLCDTKVNHAVELPTYCNSWSDIGGVIAEHKIGLIPPMDYQRYQIWTANAFDADGDEAYEYTHRNPLRAAAIVFLMINGVKP